MNQSDKPIHPSGIIKGITIREHVAIEVLKSLIIRHNISNDIDREDELIKKSFDITDNFLKQL